MKQLKKKLIFETAFSTYTLTELLGEGGAGKVYGGTSPDGELIAVKVLAGDRVTSDKRRRFKNETQFLLRNKSPLIVTVLDYGRTTNGEPFYVMKRYDGSLRDVIHSSLSIEDKLRIYCKVLNGVEASHLTGAVHRDLKPENILWHAPTLSPAIADFGIANFTDDVLATAVETSAAQRLANFQYAAPEQRVPGRVISAAADIYALGLMLNEIFTKEVPHGTGYRTIEQVAPEMAFLDPIVAAMTRQSPAERPKTVGDVQGQIELYRTEYVSRQRLSAIRSEVIPEGEIDDPLAFTPPKVIGVDWVKGVLIIKLDQAVNANWVNALHNMGNFTSISGVGPGHFTFGGDIVRVQVSGGDAPRLLEFFKQWLPSATNVLRSQLEAKNAREKNARREELKLEREAEETRLRVIASIKF